MRRRIFVHAGGNWIVRLALRSQLWSHQAVLQAMVSHLFEPATGSGLAALIYLFSAARLRIARSSARHHAYISAIDHDEQLLTRGIPQLSRLHVKIVGGKDHAAYALYDSWAVSFPRLSAGASFQHPECVSTPCCRGSRTHQEPSEFRWWMMWLEISNHNRDFPATGTTFYCVDGRSNYRARHRQRDISHHYHRLVARLAGRTRAGMETFVPRRKRIGQVNPMVLVMLVFFGS